MMLLPLPPERGRVDRVGVLSVYERTDPTRLAALADLPLSGGGASKKLETTE
jgi:hypothetical protein